MKIFLTILVFFVSSYIFAQDDIMFNKNYPYEYYCRTNNMQIVENNYILNGGVKYENTQYDQWLQGLFITHIDSIGEIQNIYKFSKPDWMLSNGTGGFHINNEGEYAISGMEFSLVNEDNNLFFLKLNAEFDTIAFYKFYEDTLSKRCWNMQTCKNNSYILVGGIDSTHSEYSYPDSVFTQTLLIKLNQEGILEWIKSYKFNWHQNEKNYQYGTEVIETWDKGFVICGVHRDFTNHTYNTFIMKVDSLGNYKWKRLFSAAPYDAPDIMDIIETKDSCYVICGAKNYGEVFGGLYPYDGWLYKFDTNGFMKWQKTYREYHYDSGDWRDTIYCYFYSMAELEDGRIAVTGQVRKDAGNANTTPFIYLLTPQGDTIFSKLLSQYPIGHPDRIGEAYPNKILATDDGGFAIGGWGVFFLWHEETQNWELPERIFLIKTDSLGNDGVVISYDGNITVIEDFKLEIYPNPATDEFNFELPTDIKTDILEIYSTNGAVIYEQKVQTGTNKIDIESLPAGMYLVRIRGANLFGKFVKE